MDIHEKTQEFLGLLKTYCSKPHQSLPSPHEAQLANQDWAASHFVFVFLKHADLPHRPTLETLQKFRDKYLVGQNIDIDVTSLLNRHWVRIWGGEIRIAQQIQHQFMYLRGTGKDIPKPDFWEGHEHEFQFLQRFQKQCQSEGKRSSTSKKQFLELADNHRTVFPKTPDADGFFKSGWFRELSDGTVSIDFHTDPGNQFIANEIAVIVWKELVTENEGTDHSVLLKKWEDKVFRNGFYPSGFLTKLPNPDREKFIGAILQQIKNEEDLLRPENEILKAKLDYYMNDSYVFHPDKMPDFPLEQRGGYGSFEEVRHWDLILGDLFNLQLARYSLNTYLREILIFEKMSPSKTWEKSYLKNTEKLLEFGQTRPVLLYTLYELVEKDFPEVIPVFFRSIENIGIGTFIVQYAPIRPEILSGNHRRSPLPEQQFRSLLFHSAFEITLEKLALQRNGALAGKAVCEALLMLSKWVFNTKETENREGKKEGTVAGETYRRFQNAWSTIESRRADIWFLKDTKPFLEFADGFIERLDNQARLPTRNNLKYLDLSYLALLSSLSQIVQSNQQAFPEGGSLDRLEQRIRTAFIKKYCDEFKVDRIDVLDVGQNCFINGDANWAFEPDHPDFLGFQPLFTANRSELGKFLDAVSPQGFKWAGEDEAPPGKNGPDEGAPFWLLDKEGKNRSEKTKCRTHFRILLRLYRAFADERVKRKIGSTKWRGAEDQIRHKLLDWAGFNRESDEAGVFNIYDTLLSNFYASMPPMIQDVVQAVNLFPDEAKRFEYIVLLTDGMTRLDLLLEIHNSLFDIPCRNHVKGVITKIDINKFTGSQYLWRPIESALIEATNDGSFQTIAKSLLAFVKERGNLKKTVFGYQRSKLLFEIQLILAHRKNDRKEMELAAEEYRDSTNGQDEDYLQKRLQFYDCIFLMAETKWREASHIWKKLSESDASVDVHYRKFYCEVQLAYCEEEQYRTKRISTAYDGWEKYESEQGDTEDLGRFWDGIQYCKMAYLNAIESDAEFDFYASQLNQNATFGIDVLHLIFENYSRRGLNGQAGHLFMEAMEYFRKFDKESLGKLESLKHMISWNTALDSLKSAIEFLNTTSIENLVKVVPSVFNEYETVPEFLLYEFKYVIEELLGKLKSADSILLPDEDNYNDVVALLLRLRLSSFRFEIGDQPREGVSPNGKRAGEVDITIRHGGRKIAAYEAFIFRDKPRTEEHLTKVFKYNPTGQLFFSVVLHRGADDQFEARFKKYKAILKNTPFLKRHKLQGGFENVPDFPSLGNLLFGKTTHGKSKAIMFHVFVNLAYGAKGALGT